MDAKGIKRGSFFSAAREVVRTARQLWDDFGEGLNTGQNAIAKLQAVRSGNTASASEHPVAEIIREDDLATAQFEMFHRSQPSRRAYHMGHSLTHIPFNILATGRR